MTELLGALGDTEATRLPARNTAVIVAHPDDETIGCGAQLARLDGISIVLVTDGAPRNLKDAHSLGFDTIEAYANARYEELLAALDAGGARVQRVTPIAIPDQNVAPNLAPITLRLRKMVEEYRIDTVITHAYEGGHPDHDSVAFCVHAVAALQARDGGQPISIVEMPFYRLGASTAVYQQFPEHDHVPQMVLPMSGAQQRQKRQMIAAYRTQARILARFSVELERFRAAPNYDFRQLPNEGRLLYECFDWGLNAPAWRMHVGQARAELGMADLPC